MALRIRSRGSDRSGLWIVHLASLVNPRLTRHMLQIDVTICEDGSFRTKPVFKTTSLGPPLCLTSAHPMRVLVQWPKSVMRSFDDLVTRPQDVIPARMMFASRLREYHYPEWYISRILQQAAQPRVPRVKSDRNASYLVIPWHSCYASGAIEKALAFLRRSPSWRGVLRSLGLDDLDVRVAWSRAAPAAQFRIRAAGQADEYGLRMVIILSIADITTYVFYAFYVRATGVP